MQRQWKLRSRRRTLSNSRVSEEAVSSTGSVENAPVDPPASELSRLFSESPYEPPKNVNIKQIAR